MNNEMRWTATSGCLRALVCLVRPTWAQARGSRGLVAEATARIIPSGMSWNWQSSLRVLEPSVMISRVEDFVREMRTNKLHDAAR